MKDVYIVYPLNIKTKPSHYSYVVQKLWKMTKGGTSLVAQWLRLCLPRQGVQV